MLGLGDSLACGLCEREVRASLSARRSSSIAVLSGVVKLRKTNYRQQKKSREDARKVRKTEKLGKRQTSTTKPDGADDTQGAASKTREGI